MFVRKMFNKPVINYKLSPIKPDFKINGIKYFKHVFNY